MPHMLVLEHVSPATRLLEKRRQMFEVQEVLDAQKAGFDRKEDIFKRQEDSLKKKDLDLQESLIKFSKFLQENDSKISRAEKKGRAEIALRQQKEAEIAELEQALDDLKKKFDTVNEVVEKHLKYQRYLEAVVEEDSDLQEVGELLNRHATLIATNCDLKQQQRANNEEMERVRADMTAFAKRRNDEILSKSNEVAVLKRRLEALQLQAAGHEVSKNAALASTSRNTLEYGQARAPPLRCPAACATTTGAWHATRARCASRAWQTRRRCLCCRHSSCAPARAGHHLDREPLPPREGELEDQPRGRGEPAAAARVDRQLCRRLLAHAAHVQAADEHLSQLLRGCCPGCTLGCWHCATWPKGQVAVDAPAHHAFAVPSGHICTPGLALDTKPHCATAQTSMYSCIATRSSRLTVQRCASFFLPKRLPFSASMMQ
jgi:Domain of unknown function (DUF4200)